MMRSSAALTSRPDLMMKIESRLPDSLPSGSTVWLFTCLKIGYLAFAEDARRDIVLTSAGGAVPERSNGNGVSTAATKVIVSKDDGAKRRVRQYAVSQLRRPRAIVARTKERTRPLWA